MVVCDQIFGTFGDHPDDRGQPSLSWCVTKLQVVGDPPGMEPSAAKSTVKPTIMLHFAKLSSS